jgi:1-acyl-sn-glycerol-3-phosphate acyltransferase
MRDYTNFYPSVRRNFLTRVLHLIVPVLLDLKITGVENIPATGPVILISNHISFLDPTLVVSMLPRPAIPMSKIENLEDKILGPLARAFDAFPVQRGEVDRRALHTALRVLEAGLLLWIAPEGTRSPSGQLQRAQNGLAFIATRSGAPVVPSAFTGTDRFKYNLRRFKRTQVSLVIGAPFYLDGHVRGAALTRLTDKAMRHIAALLPPELRGVYSDGVSSQ